MSGSFVLFSRLFVGICAAVILIAMRSHAARASPAVPITQKTVKYSMLRRLNPEQQVPSLAGQLGKEQVQTPADALSISNHQSYPVHFTQGSFIYSQNSLDKTRPRVKIIKLHRGGMMRPASSIFTTYSSYKGPGFDESTIPDNSLPQKDENTENMYNSNINWIKYPKKPGSEGGIPITPLSKVDEDKSARKLNSVFPSQTGRFQSAQLLPQRGLGSDFLETNQLPTVRVRSGASWTQLKNILDFTNQAWGGAQSLSNSLSVNKRKNTSQEKPTSISKFPQNQNSVSGKEMLQHNNIRSYLFKESPAQIYTVKNVGQKALRGQRNTANWAQKQSLSGTQEKRRFISNLNHFTRADPNKEESEALTGFGRRQDIFYPPPHKAAAPTLGFLYPVSEDKNQQNLVSAVHSQDSRKAFVVLDRINMTSREPRQEYTAGQSVKRFHRLNGLTNPERKPVKEMSGPSSADRTLSTLDEGVDIGFKFSNAYPSLSQKYSFGQKRAAATTTTPAKLGRVKMSPPSPVTQVSSTTTVQPFTSMLQSQQPETGARMNKNENRFRPYKGRFGLEGHGSQPLEGAKALSQSADSPVKPKPSFKGFELRNSEVSRQKPIRIYRLYNQRDKEPGSSGDFKMPPKISRADGSISRFASNKTHILQGFLPSKNRTVGTHNRTSWKYPAGISPLVSSSYLSSLEQPTDELKPKAADGNKPAAEEVPKFRTFTSRTVRGKRVKLTQTGSRRLLTPIAINSTGNSVIRRLPRVKAVTYEDVLGSASFSSVRSPGRHQDHFPNMTTVQGEGSKSDDVKNMSGSPKANVTEENVYRKEEADNEVETSDLFLESEGSGSLDLSDVLSIASENEPTGNDLLELDYLRKSTGNVSFKSLSKSHLEQQ